jgi:chloramphenicol phosphotransferase-like protein
LVPSSRATPVRGELNARPLVRARSSTWSGCVRSSTPGGTVVEADSRCREWFTVYPGPILDSAMHARYRAIRLYLEDGMNVIADDVIWKRAWLLDALRISRAARSGWWDPMYRTRRALAGRSSAVIAMPGGTAGAPGPRTPMSCTTSSWTPRTARLRCWRASLMRRTRRAATLKRSTGSANASFPERFDPTSGPIRAQHAAA